MKVSEQPYATLPHFTKRTTSDSSPRYGAGSASSVERLDWTIRGSNPCTHKRRYLGFTLPPISRCRRCIRGVRRSGPEVGHLPASGVELNIKYSCTSSPPIRMRGGDYDNFALTFEAQLWSQSRTESDGERKISSLKVHNQSWVTVAMC
jgi:hypothetical protein